MSPFNLLAPKPNRPFIKISPNLSMALDSADHLSSLGFRNTTFLFSSHLSDDSFPYSLSHSLREGFDLSTQIFSTSVIWV